MEREEIRAHCVPHLMQEGGQAGKLIPGGILAVMGPGHVGQRVLLAQHPIVLPVSVEWTTICGDAAGADQTFLRIQVWEDASLCGWIGRVLGQASNGQYFVCAWHVSLVVVGVWMPFVDEIRGEIVESVWQGVAEALLQTDWVRWECQGEWPL